MKDGMFCNSCVHIKKENKNIFKQRIEIHVYYIKTKELTIIILYPTLIHCFVNI